MGEGAMRERVFKTAWFSKAARKSRITDEELCLAISQVMLGQADDLGGGVYKKRLGRNLYRSIILAKAPQYWVYSFLFAKQDRANISSSELGDFRKLAAALARKTDADVEMDLRAHILVEICHGEEEV
jgi:hypothetical protein